MASRPSKPKIHNPSSSTTTFRKYAETCFLTHRRRNCRSPIGVLSVGDDWNDSGLVNHDASSMVPLPTEASINWNVNSDDKSGCSDRNFTSSSEEVEASLSWLLNAHSDGVEDEVSTTAFENYASTYFPMETSHRRRNSKPPRGVLTTIGTSFEDDNASLPPLPSKASINWL